MPTPIKQRRLTTRIVTCGFSLLCVLSLPTAGATAQTPSPFSKEIDAEIWSVFVKTVATADIVGMGNAYSPDAVLVGPGGTTPIDKTLERWGKDMVTAKSKGEKATVEFRFSKRQDDATTAFDAGMFKYTVIDKTGKAVSKIYPFEELLKKKGGKWRVLMERQFAEVTQAEWDKLPR